MFDDAVLLQFWTVDRRGRRTSKAKYRKHERAIDAVKDAWQFRDGAKLSERGVLTIQTGAAEWMRFRVRVHGDWLRPDAWRQIKELLLSQQAFPLQRRGP